MRTRQGVRIGAAAAAIALSTGCGAAGGEPTGGAAEQPGEIARAEAPASLAAPDPAEWEALESRVQAEADSVDRALRRVSNLSRTEQGTLRQDVNAPQIARARALGVRAGNAYEEAAAQGRLVRLADTTAYWVVRRLDYSVPYVTPGAEAMLAELGQRFHARLDSLALPRFRMDITSVLRTPEKQAALRRGNPNASAGVSAHEFGTTVDVAYRRFIPPAEGPAYEVSPAWAADTRALRDSVLEETASLRSAELQAVLGRVLLEMRREGKLMVMMERQQTVYHMTVARRFPGHTPVPALREEGTATPPAASEPLTAER
jgi:hypothetical protein